MGEFSVKQADADQYRIAFAGIAIAQGAGQSEYAQDEFLNIAQVSDSFGDDVGVDGATVFFKTNDRRFEATISFLQSASINDALSALLFNDVNAPNGAGIGAFNVQDLSGTTLFLATRARLIKPADIVLGRGIKGRKWKIRGVWSIWNTGSN
jgi:hypothetical protein